MSLKAGLASLILGLVLAAPARAELEIDEVVVRKKGFDAYLRVVISNPGPTTQAGPVTLSLFVRHNRHVEWVPVKVWKDIPDLPAGAKVVREFDEEGNEGVRHAARHRGLQVKAEAEAPGLETVQRIGHYHRDEEQDTQKTEP